MIKRFPLAAETLGGPPSLRNPNPSAKICFSLSGNFDPRPRVFTMKIALASRELYGFQFFFVECRRPIGRQGSVGRARHRIFRNARLRSKEPRDKIDHIIHLAFIGFQRPGPKPPGHLVRHRHRRQYISWKIQHQLVA